MASKGEPIDLTSTDDERPRKRAKTQAVENTKEAPKLSSLRASISPPRSRSSGMQTPVGVKKEEDNVIEKRSTIPKGTIIPSPFSLTNIKDLPDRLNVDSVTLKSIICDPMISELWEFNYMHDLNFIMENMDPDTRDSTKINIVHGYWRREEGLYMKASSRQAHVCVVPAANSRNRRQHRSFQISISSALICQRCTALVSISGFKPLNSFFFLFQSTSFPLNSRLSPHVMGRIAVDSY